MLNDAYLVPSGPVCIRWPKTAAPSVSADRVGSGISARLERSGSGVCLIGVGKMLAAACEAADLLAEVGIQATVWDPRVVKPLDPLMLENASRHDLVVTIEDGLRDGGIGSSIALALEDTPAKVQVLGVPTQYIQHGRPDEILSSLGLDGFGVAATIKDRLNSLTSDHSAVSAPDHTITGSG